MKNVVLDYFHQLFCESLNLNEFVTYHMTLCVSAAMNSTLLSPFQDEEFKRAIF